MPSIAATATAHPEMRVGYRRQTAFASSAHRYVQSVVPFAASASRVAFDGTYVNGGSDAKRDSFHHGDVRRHPGRSARPESSEPCRHLEIGVHVGIHGRGTPHRCSDWLEPHGAYYVHR